MENTGALNGRTLPRSSKNTSLLSQSNIFIAKLNYVRGYLNKKFLPSSNFYDIYVQEVIDILLLKLEIAL